MTETTIFQKIINEEIPCDKLYEDKFCIAFNDIQAQAPVHFLVIPKKPIISLLECIEQDANLLGHLLFVGSKIAKSKNLTNWRTCLLYTSDAADDTPCVDLGGRRIIKSNTKLIFIKLIAGYFFINDFLKYCCFSH